jgi:hypothetical protein
MSGWENHRVSMESWQRERERMPEHSQGGVDARDGDD